VLDLLEISVVVKPAQAQARVLSWKSADEYDYSQQTSGSRILARMERERLLSPELTGTVQDPNLGAGSRIPTAAERKGLELRAERKARLARPIQVKTFEIE